MRGLPWSEAVVELGDLSLQLCHPLVRRKGGTGIHRGAVEEAGCRKDGVHGGFQAHPEPLMGTYIMGSPNLFGLGKALAPAPSGSPLTAHLRKSMLERPVRGTAPPPLVLLRGPREQLPCLAPLTPCQLRKPI